MLLDGLQHTLDVLVLVLIEALELPGDERLPISTTLGPCLVVESRFRGVLAFMPRISSSVLSLVAS
jgi:hypothetical protein